MISVTSVVSYWDQKRSFDGTADYCILKAYLAVCLVTLSPSNKNTISWLVQSNLLCHILLVSSPIRHHRKIRIRIAILMIIRTVKFASLPNSEQIMSQSQYVNVCWSVLEHGNFRLISARLSLKRHNPFLGYY